jgi:Uma2 family endonuclease
MWEDDLHLVPVMPSCHGETKAALAAVIGPDAHEQNLVTLLSPGVFDPEVAGFTSYRVPDLGCAHRQEVSERGIEGRAALVVEVLVGSDEAYEQLPFHRRVGVEEVLDVDAQTKAVEVRRPHDDGWRLVAPGEDWSTPLASLDIGIRLRGDVLQIRTDTGIEEV